MDNREPVLRVTVHPRLALFALRWFKAQVYVISPSMPEQEIRVVPFPYAENIACEIGFVNPPPKN